MMTITFLPFTVSTCGVLPGASLPSLGQRTQDASSSDSQTSGVGQGPSRVTKRRKAPGELAAVLASLGAGGGAYLGFPGWLKEGKA